MSAELPRMPLVYPNLSASELNDLLMQSSWVKCKYNVEVFDEAEMGRGVRVLKKFLKFDIVCWYSNEVFDTQQLDKVYQFGNNGLCQCF